MTASAVLAMEVDVARTRVPFEMERIGTIMAPESGNPREAWGTLNPAGVRGLDGVFYLFPRVVAEGNYSRIARTKVVYDGWRPIGVERLGYALEPREPYEVNRAGGGVEDPRITYVEPLELYVMTYVAYVPPYHPRIALAVSRDLQTWQRLGPLNYAIESDTYNLNKSGNKDGLLFPETVRGPDGEPSLAILHRPTYAVHHRTHGAETTTPPAGLEHLENMWISYISLTAARADIRGLTNVYGHREFMEPRADWEALKIGGGVPPIRQPYGWLLLYHGVAGTQTATGKDVRYRAGAAVLDKDDPTHILYRSPRPIMEPTLPGELQGAVPGVVFPTAAELHGDRLIVYCGGADSIIEAAWLTLPETLPSSAV